MKTEYEIPKDATHYFLWWNGIHVYKNDGNKWFDYINGRWVEALNISYHKIKRGLFGYYLHSGSYKHKLHKINYTY